MDGSGGEGRRGRPRILSVGVAVVDHVFRVAEFPTRPEKYRAKGAVSVGGGGGANAAVAIARLGGEAWLAARVGDDATADAILAELHGDGVRTDLVRRFGGCRSSFSAVLVDDAGERMIVNYRDMALSFDADWLREGLDAKAFDALLADTRWPEGAAAAMTRASALGVPGVIDAEAPTEGCEAALQAASHVVFSAQGLRDFLGLDPDDPAPLDDALHRASTLLPGLVGVTDGPEGVRWITPGEAMRHERPPDPPDPVIDTLGAGDVWHGALAVALAERRPVECAMRFANAAATLKCVRGAGRSGTPHRTDVDAVLEAGPAPGAMDRPVAREA